MLKRYLQSPVIILILVGLATFVLALPNPFFYDDFVVIGNNSWLKSGVPPWVWLKGLYLDSNHLFNGFRPVLMNSYLVNGAVIGYEPWAYRLGNIVLHICNGLLVLLLMRRFFPDANKKYLPLVLALLFLVHPVQSIMINFIWKRSAILDLMALLTMLLVHLSEREREGYRWKVALLQILLFGTALGIKESAIMIPAILLLFDLTCLNNRSSLKTGSRSRAYWPMFAVMLVIGVVFYWFRVHYFAEQLGSVQQQFHDRHALSRLTYLLTEITVLPKYLSLLAAPRPLPVDDPMAVTTLQLPSFIIVLTTLMASIWATIKLRKQPAVVFAVLIFWLTLVPTLGVANLYLPMDQSRLHAPVLSFVIIFVLTIQWLISKTRWKPLPILLTIAVLYALSCTQQHLQYRRSAAVWEEIVHYYPKSDIGWAWLGASLKDEGQLLKAAAAYDEAAKLNPGNVQHITNRAVLMLQTGQPIEEALAELNAMDYSKMSTQAKINYAISYAMAEEHKKAEEIFLDVIARKPQFVLAHFNAGALWQKTGDLKRSRIAYEYALKLDPDFEMAKIKLKELDELEQQTKQ